MHYDNPCKEMQMKVGDLVRWKLRPPGEERVGIVVRRKGVFWKILWPDGALNGNPEWQMEVISESR